MFDDSNADENRFDDLPSDQLAENPEGEEGVLHLLCRTCLTLLSS